MRRLLQAAIWPTVSGVLYFLSWIGFGIWPLTFLCFVPLIWALRNLSLRQALFHGAWMGFITHLGGYTWLIHTLRVFAFLPMPVALLGYALLCLGQGFLFGVFALLLRWSWLRLGWGMVALAPIALCATEFAFPLLFQSYTGVALMPLLPLIQMADLGGPLLLSGLVALVNGALADALLALQLRPIRFPARALVATAVAVAVAFGYGTFRMGEVRAREKSSPKFKVGLAQPNVGETELHWYPEASVRALWAQTAQLHRQGAELVIWPEVGFNLRPLRLGDSQLAKSIQAGIQVPLIAGVIRTDGKNIWNSAVVISKEGAIGDYFDKINLLAFGEYIPFGEWFPVVYRWSPMTSHLTRGTTTAPLRVGPWKFATFICYEDILPTLVRQTMEDHGAGRANAMVNLTNDSWYGAGFEQEQHLQLAALGSAEHHRWLLRATSTGISAFVDATGQVVRRIPRSVSGVALEDVPMMQGATVYEVLGDWPGWIAALVLAIVALAQFRSRSSKQKPGRGSSRAPPRAAPSA